MNGLIFSEAEVSLTVLTIEIVNSGNESATILRFSFLYNFKIYVLGFGSGFNFGASLSISPKNK